MGSDQRRSKRIVDNLDADIIASGSNYSGIIMNFSEEGLYMVTANAKSVEDITPSTKLQLRCKLPSGENLRLHCEVKWFQAKTSPHGVSCSMGMEILNPPKQYKEFVKSIL